MNLNAKTIRKSLVVAVAGVAVVLGLAESAHAGAGGYVARPAECLNGAIRVNAPQMSPEPASAVPGAFIVGGNSQVVAFRPHLARYYPNVGWRTIQSGTWKKSSSYNEYLAEYHWKTLDGGSTYAAHDFLIPSSGTYQAPIVYAIWTEYYWYPDSSHSGGSTWSWNPHLENRGSAWNQKTYWGCQYPGPNEFKIFG